MTSKQIALVLAPLAVLFLVMLVGFTRQHIAEARRYGA